MNQLLGNIRLLPKVSDVYQSRISRTYLQLFRKICNKVCTAIRVYCNSSTYFIILLLIIITVPQNLLEFACLLFFWLLGKEVALSFFPCTKHKWLYPSVFCAEFYIIKRGVYSFFVFLFSVIIISDEWSQLLNVGLSMASQRPVSCFSHPAGPRNIFSHVIILFQWFPTPPINTHAKFQLLAFSRFGCALSIRHLVTEKIYIIIDWWFGGETTSFLTSAQVP